jgi:hypothetical protein
LVTVIQDDYAFSFPLRSRDVFGVRFRLADVDFRNRVRNEIVFESMKRLTWRSESVGPTSDAIQVDIVVLKKSI